MILNPEQAHGVKKERAIGRILGSGLMFRTQEDLEMVLLQYVLEFNDTRYAPGVIIYKGHKETRTGVLLETFPLSGIQSTPAGACSYFHLNWEYLRTVATRTPCGSRSDARLFGSALVPRLGPAHLDGRAEGA
jgi:hypothetical protein